MCGYAKDTLGRSATPGGAGPPARGGPEGVQGRAVREVLHVGELPRRPGGRPGIAATDRRPPSPARHGGSCSRRYRSSPSARPSAPCRRAFHGEIEVALGLESTDPEVLQRFVNKGSPPSEYLEAVRPGPGPGDPDEGLPTAQAAVPYRAGVDRRRRHLGRDRRPALRCDLGEPGPHPERHRGRVALPPPAVPAAVALEPRRGDADAARSSVARPDSSPSRPRADFRGVPTTAASATAPFSTRSRKRRSTSRSGGSRALECACQSDWQRHRQIEPLGVEA